MKHYFVYIMTNKPRGTLYIGVTNNIERRANEHYIEQGSAFASKYKLRRLVYIEETPDINNAIAREKQLKNWHRDWKINLIEAENPDWNDLISE